MINNQHGVSCGTLSPMHVAVIAMAEKTVELSRSFLERVYWRGFEKGVSDQAGGTMDEKLIRGMASHEGANRQFATGYHDGLLWSHVNMQFGPPSPTPTVRAMAA